MDPATISVVALPPVQELIAGHDSAAEDSEHFIAVAASLRLEILPLTRALVDAHVFDRKWIDIEATRVTLLAFLTLDILASLTFYIIVLSLC